MRSPRPGIAGGNCGGTFRRRAVLACRFQYELCLSRSSLPSFLGTCPRAPRRDFCWSRRVAVLADPPALDLDVSGGERRQMKQRDQQSRQREKMDTDVHKTLENYLAMLKTATTEARLAT